MVIRKIAPEENIEISKLRSVAYNSRKDFSDPQKAALGYETVRAVFDDCGRPAATLCTEPYTVTFNGSQAQLAGVGAVASLPQERGRGHVRKLFGHCLREMREEGQILSYLFPFSNPLYRKFGYELANIKQNIIIPLSAFGHLDGQPGRAELMEYGRDIGDIRQIYAACVQNRNLAAVRSDKQWREMFEHDKYSELISTYIWYGADGRPAAYLSFDSSAGNDMTVRETAFNDIAALKSLLGFLSRFHPYYKTLRGDVPGFIDWTLLAEEPIVVESKLKTSGMCRVVDVEKVLAYTRHREANACVNIGVTDDFLDFNNGVYRLSFEGGQTSVKRTDAEPDLVCTARSLAAFATGFVSLEQACRYGMASVTGKRELLYSLFPKKEIFMTETY